MKKFICALIAILCLGIFCSCQKPYDFSKHVSQLRLNVYEGESDNFKVTVSSEQRENPFIADGYVGQMQNVLIIKVEFKTSSPNDATAVINYEGQSLNATLSYNPVSGKSSAMIGVENLPKVANISVDVTSGEICEKLSLSSVIFDKTIDYLTAISAVQSSDKETVNRLFFDGEVLAEIHVRLISSNNKIYYYIGFVESDGKTSAYLVDGESATVLAKKNF